MKSLINPCHMIREKEHGVTAVILDEHSPTKLFLFVLVEICYFGALFHFSHPRVVLILLVLKFFF